MTPLPLWMTLALWWLYRQQARSAKRVTGDQELRAHLQRLDDLYRSVPVPANRAESFIISQIHSWIDAEKKKTRIMIDLGMLFVGQL